MNVNHVDLNCISGVAIYKNSWEFISNKNKSKDTLTLEQLATPLLMYYDDKVPRNMKQITFSLDPIDVNNFKLG